MADGFQDTGNDLRLVGTFCGFLFQLFQEVFDSPFDLTSCPWTTLVIAGFKQTSQLDDPCALPFQLSIRLCVGVADEREVQQGGQEGMPPFFWQRRKDVSRRCSSW